jgi:endonuclease YncB( thermonuclease family)
MVRSAKTQVARLGRLVFVAAILVGGQPGWALELPAGLTGGGRAVVQAVIDGDTVLLADGREVRLVGIQAPKLPLGRKGFEAWPLADVAKGGLEELVLGRAVRLAYGGRQVDRYRRQLAHLFREEDGLWVQGAMLALGLARTYTFADNRALIPALLDAERRARAVRRGIWAERYYQVLDQRQASASVDRFGLIEGKVLAVAIVRGRAFLNFGEDYRRDFTITLAPDVVELFEGEGIDIEGYANRRVRVRGWVQWRNGPSIEATHPEQIELLDR